MRLIKSHDTKAELCVREILKSLGVHYRLQYKKLPGRPDFAFPGRRKIVWVHGCFWHRHEDCQLARLPKTKREFWLDKLESNRVRDIKNEEKVKELEWQSLVIWECELRDSESIEKRLKEFLEIP